MATALKSLPKFFGLTSAQYAALTSKDANTLYFVYDEGVNGVIYRGSHVYGETVSYVSAVPAASDALKGVVYFNTTTGTAYVKSGTEMKPIGVLTVDTIDDSTTAYDTKVPNVGAVKEYVKNKITPLLHFKGVVDTVDDLPASGNEKGDVYIVKTVPATAYQPAKTNVEFVWTLDEGTGDGWEELGSTYDFSIFMQKKVGATTGDIATFNGSGDTVDSGKSISTAEAIPASSATSTSIVANEYAVAKSIEAEASARAAADATKQARDTDAVQYNAAYFDAYGNTIDSGKSMGGDWFGDEPSGTVLATELGVIHAMAIKQSRDLDAVENNAARFDAYGNTIDAGFAFGADSDTISSSSAANTLATEKAVAAAVKSTGDTKQDKDVDAVVGNVGIFDAYGNTVDGGKKQGGSTLTKSVVAIFDNDTVMYPRDRVNPKVVVESTTYYPWTKGPSTVYTNTLSPSAGSTIYTYNGTTMTSSGTVKAVATAATTDVLATEAAVETAVATETSRAETAEAKKLDKITGTNDNILLVAGNGTAVADSGKSISAETSVPASTSTSVNKIANELEVANLKETVTADYQLKDKDAVAGNIAKFDAYGNSIDGGIIAGGAAISTTAANDTTLATEEGVVALLNTMAWQIVE